MLSCGPDVVALTPMGSVVGSYWSWTETAWLRIKPIRMGSFTDLDPSNLRLLQ